MEIENILSNLVRIGTVSAVDAEGKKARVIFGDKGGITSGWLYVLQHHGAAVDVKESESHTHTIGEETTNASGEHTHVSVVSDWMPKINDMVVALYLPDFNGDGFILGAI